MVHKLIKLPCLREYSTTYLHTIRCRDIRLLLGLTLAQRWVLVQVHGLVLLALLHTTYTRTYAYRRPQQTPSYYHDSLVVAMLNVTRTQQNAVHMHGKKDTCESLYGGNFWEGHEKSACKMLSECMYTLSC